MATQSPPKDWGPALAAVLLLMALPVKTVSEPTLAVATAPELLAVVTGRDASEYQAFFSYNSEARIAAVEIYAVGLDATTARYSGQEAAYFEINNILRIITADGYEGVSGVDFYSFDDFSDALFLELQTIAEVLSELNSVDPVEVGLALSETHPQLSDAARASVDIALWDLAARRAGLPLYQLLGGTRDSITAYASLPFYNTISEQVEAVETRASLGYTVFKFHVWGNIEKDLELVSAVQKRFTNSGYRFMVDLESVYDLDDALRLGEKMDEGLFIWFEAPVDDARHDLYGELKEQLELSIIPAGYNIYSPEYIRNGIDENAWDAARFDATVVGGITPALQLLMIAENSDLPVEFQSWGYVLTQVVNLHLMLANERTAFFESPMPAEPFEFGVRNSLVYKQGRVHAPTGAGLGIEMDWDSLYQADYYQKTVFPSTLPEGPSQIHSVANDQTSPSHETKP